MSSSSVEEELLPEIREVELVYEDFQSYKEAYTMYMFVVLVSFLAPSYMKWAYMDNRGYGEQVWYRLGWETMYISHLGFFAKPTYGFANEILGRVDSLPSLAAFIWNVGAVPLAALSLLVEALFAYSVEVYEEDPEVSLVEIE